MTKRAQQLLRTKKPFDSFVKTSCVKKYINKKKKKYIYKKRNTLISLYFVFFCPSIPLLKISNSELGWSP